VVLLGLVGAWTGHLLEYVRVEGGAGLRDALLGSVHAYMLPLGALLATLVALGGLWWWRVWLALGRRLDAARLVLAGALRGHRVTAMPRAPGAQPSGAARWAALTLLLAALQVGVYLAQENVEAVAAGLRPPGLAALGGAHALAPLVHLGVAALLAALALACARRLCGRAPSIGRCARLVRVLLATLTRAVPPPPPRAAEWHASPLDRLGRQLWRRPPPARLLTR
jgi:hypothetical protein